MTLTPHPRLLASSLQLDRLKEVPQLALLLQATRMVAKEASRYVKDRKLTFDPNLHNALLLRGREMQRRVITLLVRWKQTGQERYRKAALDDVRDMGNWEYWSWHKWQEKNPDPNADFDLSCGENSATLAFAYDWMHASLSSEERTLFLEIARRKSLQPFLARTEEGQRAWWFGHANSNWNTVCAGGAGMLALAMMDDLPEAAEALRRADISVAPYMESLKATEGGWVEGIGYWNYGHRYAFWYLLSYERATGTTHPLLELRGVRETLDFPLDFCPHGKPCSFGDINHWSPLAFHYAAAERLGRPDLIERLDRFEGERLPSPQDWPNEAELLIFHPRMATSSALHPGSVSKIYPGIDWAILADHPSESSLFLSLRGGTCGWNTPHSHLDLLSFHCLAGKESLIDNISVTGTGYLDTTFSGRRFELFETTPGSKNTILINGVGITNPSSVTTIQLSGAGWHGFRMDATEAMDYLQPGHSMVRFCSRLFLFLDGPCAIVLDRVELASPGRMETRLHTYARASMARDQAEIRGRKERLQLAFAATVPSSLHRAEDALTTPGPKSTLLRWCTAKRTHTSMSMVTLLVPGEQPASVSLEELPDILLVHVQYGAKSSTLKVAADLLQVSLD